MDIWIERQLVAMGKEKPQKVKEDDANLKDKIRKIEAQAFRDFLTYRREEQEKLPSNLDQMVSYTQADIDAIRYSRCAELGTALHDAIEEQISPEKLDRFLEMLEGGNK